MERLRAYIDLKENRHSPAFAWLLARSAGAPSAAALGDRAPACQLFLWPLACHAPPCGDIIVISFN